MYLIMKCDELGDQYECDANREPITLVDDWEKWFYDTNPEYRFEVYEFNNDEFTLIKEYDNPMDSGMAFYYWTAEQMEDEEMSKPTVIQKWRNANRDTSVPESVKKAFDKGNDDELTFEDFLLELKCGGAVGWNYDGKWWVYGEYRDHFYDWGC